MKENWGALTVVLDFRLRRQTGFEAHQVFCLIVTVGQKRRSLQLGWEMKITTTHKYAAIIPKGRETLNNNNNNNNNNNTLSDVPQAR
jgi:hypothetical protein